MPKFVELTDVEAAAEREGVERVRLVTTLGAIEGRLQGADGDAAVLWVFGSGGGLGGPAGGLYTRLGGRLAAEGVASLELDYRRPGALQDCVADVLVGAAWLESLGKERLVFVGHSFGGAVVVAAALRSASVAAVAALSPQTYGAEAVADLAPRPILFVHGEADEVLPASCSTALYAAAEEPKQLILYPGCRHGLDDCREALDRDLLAWLRLVLASPSGTPG
ncbi:MAG TPA: dienelactone hydrolase family protein [Caulobacteraceae bacterium]|jgi:hypothetical protein